MTHLGLPMGWPSPVHALYSVLLTVKGKVQSSPDKARHCSTSRALVSVTIVTVSRREHCLDVS